MGLLSKHMCCDVLWVQTYVWKLKNAWNDIALLYKNLVPYERWPPEGIRIMFTPWEHLQPVKFGNFFKLQMIWQELAS